MNRSKVTAFLLGALDALDQKILASDDDRFERAYAAWGRYDRRLGPVEYPVGYLTAEGIWLPLAVVQSMSCAKPESTVGLAGCKPRGRHLGEILGA